MRPSSGRAGGVRHSWAISTSRASCAAEVVDCSSSRSTSLPPQASSHFPSCGDSTRISCSSGGSAEKPIPERHPTTSSSGRRSGSSGSGRMRVGVRVRPVFRNEAQFWSGRSGGYRPAVCARGERFRKTAGQQTCEGNSGGALRCVDLRMLDGREGSFVFDRAFDAGCGQREVYDRYKLGILIRRITSMI